MEHFDNINQQKDVKEPEYLREYVLEQFKNIACNINDESLNGEYGKKEGKLNWIKMRKLLCDEIYSALAEQWNQMWDEEKLTEKINTIRSLKEKDNQASAWRPHTGNIDYQKRCLEKCMKSSRDAALDAFLAEKEENIHKLKAELLSHWKYFTEMQQSMEKYHNENEQTFSKMEEKLLSSKKLFNKTKFIDMILETET